MCNIGKLSRALASKVDVHPTYIPPPPLSVFIQPLKTPPPPLRVDVLCTSPLLEKSGKEDLFIEK